MYAYRWASNHSQSFLIYSSSQETVIFSVINITSHSRYQKCGLLDTTVIKNFPTLSTSIIDAMNEGQIHISEYAEELINVPRAHVRM